MKRSIFIALFALLCAPTFAQNWRGNDRDQTLASSSGRHGFFIAPIVEYSDLKDKWSTSVGGGLAFVAGDFFIGGYGLGMVEENWLDNDFEKLDMGQGGFWLGYTTPQNKAVHLFSSVKAGWGAVNIELEDEFDYEDAFFAVTPEAGLELNVFSWFRVGATVGYRFMNGLDESPNFDKDKLQGMTGALTFRIGGFGRDRHRDDW
ncbi:MAG: hypothetical protein R2788_23890 [Saprospiraceae bacterium]